MATTNVGRAGTSAAGTGHPTSRTLPVPDEVLEFVVRELEGRQPAESARRDVLNSFTLQYHYGGREVVTRRTEEGVEVHAVGTTECAEFLRGLTEQERDEYWVEYPDSWQPTR